jgi:acyl carrier protein
VTLSTTDKIQAITDRQAVTDDMVTWLRNAIADDDITAGDRFLELGGHSMMAIQLRAWLADMHGVEIDIAVLFQSTLEKTAEAAVVKGTNR